ncbi:MAG: tyrosine--tRNA ligase [Anaerolineae bacterium]|nr:tyrosine--tRNA ligase [Anaerolineae bacterium]MCO5194300.1 tyrosine--tRNA ligase [Anaerolineae bacterium]
MSNIFEELQWRDQIFDHTEEIKTLLATEKVTVYNGFDPTADSLHVGNLVPMMQLARLQRFGHTPIALAGGGTGMIGDPSGKSAERNLLSAEQIAANVAGIQPQLAAILDFEVKSNPARIVNNIDWLGQLKLVEFMRDIGKHFTVNYMLAKDSVKSRIERESGLSFTEFSYMLFQAYDFLHLFEHEGCTMQVGGSDQWGNILAGVELIRRKLGVKVHALVYPLLTKADGTKFGKTETGSVWLNAEKTSPFRFYQFWFNTSDDDVVNYLKTFTWLDQDTIAELSHATAERPHERAAQRRLAGEVTRMIHGESGLASAEQATAVLFGGSLDGISARDIADIFAGVASHDVPRVALAGDGMPLIDMLAESTLATSKGDAKRAIAGGGISLNNHRVDDVGYAVTVADALDGQYAVLRKGKKRYHLVRLLD